MNYIKLLTLTFGLLVLASCNVDEILNPNSPTVESYENGATLADLQLLAQGLEATIRDDMEYHWWTTCIVGREYLDLRGVDPRFTSELLGQNGGDLDNNGFITTRSFAARYRSVRNANLLKTAVTNSAATLSDGEVNSFMGFANTIIGYELLLEAVRQYENGIRLDVEDPNNLGPFTNSFQESLNGIKAILDNAYDQLSSAPDDFLFNISSGFSSIGGTETGNLAKFNRAIAARCNLYRGDAAATLDALGNSFLDQNGDLDMGGYYSFGGATGNDLENMLFYVPNADLYLAHPSWIDDMEAGDNRISKVALLDSTQVTLPVLLDGLRGSYQVQLYASATSPAVMIRNEELILIYAETMIGSDNDAAVAAINVIRNAAGVGDYTGGMDDASLIDEVLHQRRYSLFAEGHRWVDLRRYDRLDEVPTDRAGDKVHVQFPRPATEN